MRPDDSYCTRPADDVIGCWVRCDCYRGGQPDHETCAGKQLWLRVPSKTLEALTAHKSYAERTDFDQTAQADAKQLKPVWTLGRAADGGEHRS